MKTIEKQNNNYGYVYSNRYKQTAVLIMLFGVFLLLANACTTRKNTKITRTYHNITSHYNVYFNGNESLKAGSLRLKKEYKEDYNKILPIYVYENPDAADMVSSDMDRTIKKSAKTIKLHSITVKPKSKKKNLTREEQAFLAQAEYCKWIDNAYLIMAKAYFYKHEFETAKQMLYLVINKYKSKDTKYEAMLWLAKTYVQLEAYSSAENTLIDLNKVKKHDKKYKVEMNLVYASMYIKQNKYTEAARKLRKVVEIERNRKDKIRHLFILAQIYQYNDKYKLAETYYKKVIKKNPNYDMAFTAKIRLAEIFEKNGGDGVELKKQLLKMSKDEKNIDYLDQIYYALGKIELNEQNNEKAIEYFTLSSQSASSNNTQKVKTYIALAEHYYTNNNLKLSTAYYDSVYNEIEPTFPDYEKIFPQIDNRHLLTKELYTIVHEDSLQRMANMSEAERNKVIDKIIQDIVEEEAKQKAQNNNSSMGYDPIFDNNYGTTKTNPMQGGKYYFYNPSTVSLGMTDFKKKWGDRRLSDHWRRSNKQVNTSADVNNGVDTASVAGKSAADTTQSGGNKLVTNVKTREYYLQNLPLTDEKMAKSNETVQAALFESATIYNKKMNEPAKAIQQYEILLKRFPQTTYRKETLHRLYTLYNNELNQVKSEEYKMLIINEFPESVYAKLLKDPEYAAKLMNDEKLAETLYQTAVANYKNKQYSQCIIAANEGLTKYPNSDLIPNFIYVKAIAHAGEGNHKELRKNLDILIGEYPETEVAKSAKGIIDVLNTGKFKKDLYQFKRDTIHYYVLIFKKENVDKNRLSFNFKSFNLDKYTQSDFQVDIIEFNNEKDMLIVKDFKNGSQAEKYYNQINYSDVLKDFKKHISSHFVITPNNYQEFLKNKLEDKYLKFYKQYSLPLSD